MPPCAQCATSSRLPILGKGIAKNVGLSHEKFHRLLFLKISYVDQAFRVACHCGDSDAEVEELLGTVSGAVLNKLIIFMLREVLARFVGS